MIKARKAGPTIGCLLIEDFSSGGQKLSGLCDYLKRQGAGTEVFRWGGEGDLYECLMDAFQRVRSRCGIGCIIAWGTGIYGAVALSVQLPVERIVLIDAPQYVNENVKGSRQINRLRRFVRRNGAFCLTDALFVSTQDENNAVDMQRLMNCLVNANIKRTGVCGIGNKKTCTNDEHIPKDAIYRFLTTGEFAKQLAENSEMCIIYE